MHSFNKGALIGRCPLALGAYRRDIIRLVLKQGMAQTGFGVMLGMGLGMAMSRPLQMVSFRVNPNDPTVYAAIIVTLTLAGVLACIVPALRATQVNLVDALRAE